MVVLNISYVLIPNYLSPSRFQNLMSLPCHMIEAKVRNEAEDVSVEVGVILEEPAVCSVAVLEVGEEGSVGIAPHLGVRHRR